MQQKSCWLLSLGLLVALGSFLGARGRADEPKPKTPAPDAVTESILKRLRLACTAQAPLRGVLVRKGEVKDGQLELVGFVDTDNQRKLLQDAAEGFIAAVPEWKSHLPKGVSARAMEVLAIRSVYLPTLQRDLATGNGVDPQSRDLLRQVRLDDAYYDEADGNLIFEGVCVKEKTTPDDEVAILVAVSKLLKEYLTPVQFEKKNLGVKKCAITYLTSPRRVLQRLCNNDPSLDGVWIRSATFTPAGDLRFAGYYENEEQRERLVKLMTREMGNVALSRSRPKPETALADLQPFALSEQMKRLQETLAKDPSPVLKRTLLDRAYFDPDGKLVVQSVSFPESAAPAEGGAPAKPPVNELAARIRDWFQAQPQTARVIVDIAVPPAALVRHPRQLIQPKVGEHHLLDGVRIDGAVIDEIGRLSLEGIWAEPAQAKELEKVFRSLVQGDEGRLIRHGFSWKGMHPVRTDQILHKLREWTAANLDEVWLDRLYYNDKGHLKVRGLWPDNTAVRETLAARIKAECASDATGRLLDGGQKAQPPSAFLDAPAPRPNRQSLLGQLRSLVAENRRLDGISLQRGYYDVTGVFTVSGLQDYAGQADRLRSLLDQTLSGSEWKEQLPHRWRVGGLEVVPLRPLLVYLTRVMPAQDILDGIQLSSAHHDADNRLVLGGRRVGGGNRSTSEKLVNQFLRQHPSGRTRLAAGPALLSLVEQPRDLEVAREAVLDSFASVHCGQFGRSIRDLDTALLHNPEDSTAWYLRALCYLAGNDLELVNRDLRRMIALEARDTDQPYRRTQRLERIQGALRVVLGRIEDDLKTR